MRFLWDRVSEMILGAGHQFIYLEAWREQDARDARQLKIDHAHPRAFKPPPTRTAATEDLGIELMPLRTDTDEDP